MSANLMMNGGILAGVNRTGALFGPPFLDGMWIY